MPQATWSPQISWDERKINVATAIEGGAPSAGADIGDSGPEAEWHAVAMGEDNGKGASGTLRFLYGLI